MAALNVFQPEDIEPGHHIGSSDASSVFLGKIKTTGETVALKNITHIQRREVDILKSLQHDNIVRLIGTIHRDNATGMELILEYAHDGNLYDFINTKHRSIACYRTWCKQAVNAVAYIHELDIFHRDIKSKNYLVFGDVIKLCDFGLSKMKLDMTKSSIQNLGGTILWMSPEKICEKKDIDHFKSDIYSLGIVLWELYHQRKPYDGWNPPQILLHVTVQKGHLEIDDKCDGILRKVLLNCWEYEPSKRPSAGQILMSLNKDNEATTIENRPPIENPDERTVIYGTGIWLVLGLAFVVGVFLNILVTDDNLGDLIKLTIFEQMGTPPTEPHMEPTTQPNAETTQPTTKPTTETPKRDWQKEGLNQIRLNNRKEKRSGTITVYDREFKYKSKMDWFKHYATATDIATNIEAKAGGYQSRGGSNEHAIENLINKLMAQGVIKN